MPAPGVSGAARGVDAFDDIETARRVRPVAPGLTLTSFDRYHAAGWLRADALTADLSGELSADYVNSGEVARTEPLRTAADRTRAVAAVNGDFFDINASGAAQGIGIQSGRLIQSPVRGASTPWASRPAASARWSRSTSTVRPCCRAVRA
ncbi:hypothetical protein Psuf_019830 [Phytohabitans suffuscus]|uniref:Uncharacterized protein n=1 Tax=Phytohabitans suffuscus TaxID=624315 RepID=A0A6F8YF31_9ACTN|nr:hypothetical protein [Phytohabitans suffuscus]BCB84670.1 hypothetical protein Psuf_019830 [Phytohabitans suffuscus]